MLLKLRMWRKQRRKARESESLVQQVQRRARRIIITVVSLVALTCLVCLLMALWVGRVSAQTLTPEVGGGQTSAESQRIDVILVIDNSNSMFDKAGIGSDPELRRIEAAHLFIHYQGVDSGMTDHRVGVIFFGGTARSVVPLTFLNQSERRAEIAGLIAHPERMQWTDPVAALALSQQILETDSAPDRERVVVLLTDGKPEWDTTPTAEERASVIAELEALGQAYTQQGITLFVMLLENAATDGDSEIAQVYVPLWRALTSSTGGRFYAVREADALIDVYHDILLTLSGGVTAGTVVDAQVTGERQVHTIAVESALRRVTFVVRVNQTSSTADQVNDMTVVLARPSGRALQSSDAGVRHSAYGNTAIWAIDHPEAGTWSVQIEGQGSVTVWKDYVPEPTSTPSPTPTPVPHPTATPSPVPTVTPAPTLKVVQWPQAVLAGAPMTLSFALAPVPVVKPEVWVEWGIDGSSLSKARLLDDGQNGDDRADDGNYTTTWTPDISGILTAHAWIEVKGLVLDTWDGRVVVESTPHLFLDIPNRGLVWRAGRTEPLLVSWIAGEDTPLAVGGSLSVTVLDVSGSVVATASGEMGKALGVPVPATAGTYTVTVQATGRTPSWQPFVDTTAIPLRVRRPVSGWIIGGGLAGLMSVIGGWRGWNWYRRLPRLTGKLRILEAPADYGENKTLDLSALYKRRLALGGTDGHFPIQAEAQPWAELEAMADGSGATLTATGTAPIRVNAREGIKRHTLADRDTISVGEFKLRYECL
ncbi:MAG: VWA domain-containing protein [Anaerolineae bacterium]|nr:VWA domain-containing protein [Anaerolineae bacterium]